MEKEPFKLSEKLHQLASYNPINLQFFWACRNSYWCKNFSAPIETFRNSDLGDHDYFLSEHDLIALRDKKHHPEWEMNPPYQVQRHSNYSSALHVAMYHHHVEVVTLLRRHGARIDARNLELDLPLHDALVSFGKESRFDKPKTSLNGPYLYKLARNLHCEVETGGKCDVPECEHYNTNSCGQCLRNDPAMYLVQRCITCVTSTASLALQDVPERVMKEHREELKNILTLAELRKRRRTWNLVQAACACGNLEALKVLLSLGRPQSTTDVCNAVLERDSDGWTCLHYLVARYATLGEKILGKELEEGNHTLKLLAMRARILQKTTLEMIQLILEVNSAIPRQSLLLSKTFNLTPRRHPLLGRLWVMNPDAEKCVRIYPVRHAMDSQFDGIEVLDCHVWRGATCITYSWAKLTYQPHRQRSIALRCESSVMQQEIGLEGGASLYYDDCKDCIRVLSHKQNEYKAPDEIPLGSPSFSSPTLRENMESVLFLVETDYPSSDDPYTSLLHPIIGRLWVSLDKTVKLFALQGRKSETDMGGEIEVIRSFLWRGTEPRPTGATVSYRRNDLTGELKEAPDAPNLQKKPQKFTYDPVKDTLTLDSGLRFETRIFSEEDNAILQYIAQSSHKSFMKDKRKHKEVRNPINAPYGIASDSSDDEQGKIESKEQWIDCVDKDRKERCVEQFTLWWRSRKRFEDAHVFEDPRSFLTSDTNKLGDPNFNIIVNSIKQNAVSTKTYREGDGVSVIVWVLTHNLEEISALFQASFTHKETPSAREMRQLIAYMFDVRAIDHKNYHWNYNDIQSLTAVGNWLKVMQFQTTELDRLSSVPIPELQVLTFFCDPNVIPCGEQQRNDVMKCFNAVFSSRAKEKVWSYYLQNACAVGDVTTVQNLLKFLMAQPQGDKPLMDKDKTFRTKWDGEHSAVSVCAKYGRLPVLKELFGNHRQFFDFPEGQEKALKEAIKEKWFDVAEWLVNIVPLGGVRFKTFPSNDLDLYLDTFRAMSSTTDDFDLSVKQIGATCVSIEEFKFCVKYNLVSTEYLEDYAWRSALEWKPQTEDRRMKREFPTGTALVLVDLQKDFFKNTETPSPESLLRIADEDYAKRVKSFLMDVKDEIDFLVVALNWHPPDHESFTTKADEYGTVMSHKKCGEMSRWPQHCVGGTDGAQLHTEIDEIIRQFQVESPTKFHCVLNGRNKSVNSFSVFFDGNRQIDSGLYDVLVARHVKRVFFLGIATDVRVKHSSIDAKMMGIEQVYVIEDLCTASSFSVGDDWCMVEVPSQKQSHEKITRTKAELKKWIQVVSHYKAASIIKAARAGRSTWDSKGAPVVHSHGSLSYCKVPFSHEQKSMLRRILAVPDVAFSQVFHPFRGRPFLERLFDHGVEGEKIPFDFTFNCRNPREGELFLFLCEASRSLTKIQADKDWRFTIHNLTFSWGDDALQFPLHYLMMLAKWGRRPKDKENSLTLLLHVVDFLHEKHALSKKTKEFVVGKKSVFDVTQAIPLYEEAHPSKVFYKLKTCTCIFHKGAEANSTQKTSAIKQSRCAVLGRYHVQPSDLSTEKSETACLHHVLSCTPLMLAVRLRLTSVVEKMLLESPFVESGHNHSGFTIEGKPYQYSIVEDLWGLQGVTGSVKKKKVEKATGIPSPLPYTLTMARDAGTDDHEVCPLESAVRPFHYLMRSNRVWQQRFKDDCEEGIEAAKVYLSLIPVGTFDEAAFKKEVTRVVKMNASLLEFEISTNTNGSLSVDVFLAPNASAVHQNKLITTGIPSLVEDESFRQQFGVRCISLKDREKARVVKTYNKDEYIVVSPTLEKSRTCNGAVFFPACGLFGKAIPPEFDDDAEIIDPERSVKSKLPTSDSAEVENTQLSEVPSIAPTSTLSPPSTPSFASHALDDKRPWTIPAGAKYFCPQCGLREGDCYDMVPSNEDVSEVTFSEMERLYLAFMKASMRHRRTTCTVNHDNMCIHIARSSIMESEQYVMPFVDMSGLFAVSGAGWLHEAQKFHGGDHGLAMLLATMPTLVKDFMEMGAPKLCPMKSYTDLNSLITQSLCSVYLVRRHLWKYVHGGHQMIVRESNLSLLHFAALTNEPSFAEWCLSMNNSDAFVDPSSSHLGYNALHFASYAASSNVLAIIIEKVEKDRGKVEVARFIDREARCSIGEEHLTQETAQLNEYNVKTNRMALTDNIVPYSGKFNSNCETPLHTAASFGHALCVDLLLGPKGDNGTRTELESMDPHDIAIALRHRADLQSLERDIVVNNESLEEVEAYDIEDREQKEILDYVVNKLSGTERNQSKLQWLGFSRLCQKYAVFVLFVIFLVSYVVCLFFNQGLTSHARDDYFASFAVKNTFSKDLEDVHTLPRLKTWLTGSFKDLVYAEENSTFALDAPSKLFRLIGAVRLFQNKVKHRVCADTLIGQTKIDLPEACYPRWERMDADLTAGTSGLTRCSSALSRADYGAGATIFYPSDEGYCLDIARPNISAGFAALDNFLGPGARKVSLFFTLYSLNADKFVSTHISFEVFNTGTMHRSEEIIPLYPQGYSRQESVALRVLLILCIVYLAQREVQDFHETFSHIWRNICHERQKSDSHEHQTPFIILKGLIKHFVGWNAVDLSVICLCVAGLIYEKRVVDDFENVKGRMFDRKDYVEFRNMALNWKVATGCYSMAILFAFLMFLKATHYIPIMGPYARAITQTLLSVQVIVFATLLVVSVVGLSFAVFVAFGHSNFEYRSISSALLRCFQNAIGNDDYSNMAASNADLATFLYFFIYLYFNLLILNVLIAIVGDEYKDHKQRASEKWDVEMVGAYRTGGLGLLNLRSYNGKLLSHWAAWAVICLHEQWEARDEIPSAEEETHWYIQWVQSWFQRCMSSFIRYVKRMYVRGFMPLALHLREDRSSGLVLDRRSQYRQRPGLAPWRYVASAVVKEMKESGHLK